MAKVFGSDMGDVDELTKEFLAESLDGLDRMERCLTELEQRPADKELLAEIFRSVHTIKGTTGFLGFGRLEKLAHAGETLLGSLRDGRLSATPHLVGGLLRLMDGLRTILALIEQTGGEGTRASDEDSELIGLLEDLHGNREARGVVALTGGAPLIPGKSEKTLRVQVDVLNRMMNLVGELVLTRNQIVQGGGGAEDFSELARRLDNVTAELRECVMQARMQPVGQVFGKFPRLVRDLALQCGKQVRLEIAGQETGLDKSLLEAIRDPLTHAVRNAIDHGIEEPRVREALGKPAQGVVHLRAYHQHASVVVEVEDDGAGISTTRVLTKALERGVVSEEEALAMTEMQTMRLIFQPGLSTSDQLTNISGRGVGMDVVLSQVEKAGGTVELESEEGKGTLLRLRVPLTLAIVPALVVRCGRERFCLPQSALSELVSVPVCEVESKLEWMGETELFRLREELLPIVRLDRMLGLDRPLEDASDRCFSLAVVETQAGRYGLVVDELIDREEIVVKPLSPVLREIGLYSGATVLGTGSLALILDVTAIGVRAGMRLQAKQPAARPDLVAPRRPGTLFLIFEEYRHGRLPDRIAIPLSAVVRIETVAWRQVEFAGGRALIRFAGGIVPLHDRDGMLLQSQAHDPDATVTVLVCERGQRQVGLVVRQILDVAEGDLVEDGARLCEDPLALVNERLALVHEAFARETQLRNVA